MQFESSLGGSDDSAYFDPNPALGTDGSRVPAAAIDYPQRELVHLIEFAGLTPDRADLQQVRKAIAALIAAAARPRLLANLDYYVSPSGSDSNTGLSALAPFLTPQKAITETFKLDLNGFTVTINLANGTYTSPVSIGAAVVGEGSIILRGNTGAPQNVLLSTTGADAIHVKRAQLLVEGMQLQAAGGVSCAVITGDGGIATVQSCHFGATAGHHMQAGAGGQIKITGNVSVVGGAAGAHVRASEGGVLKYASGVNVTISGGPHAFTSFANAHNLGMLFAQGISISGSATGFRFGAANNGVIDTNGGAAGSYFPGSAPGFTAAGGQYL